MISVKKIRSLFRRLCVLFVAAVFVTRYACYVFSGDEVTGHEPKNRVGIPESTRPGVKADKVFPVILFAYQRGGSSFTGRVLASHPDAFYWLEPLTGLAYHLYGKTYPYSSILDRSLNFRILMNGTLRQQPDYEREASLQHVNNIMECRLSKLDQKTLGKDGYLRTSPQLWPYKKCFENLGGHNLANKEEFLEAKLCPHPSHYFPLPEGYTCKSALRKALQGQKHGFNQTLMELLRRQREKLWGVIHECLPKMQDACERSRLRVIKLLRVNMDFVGHYLASHPDTLVIHLLRDPRGILRSRGNTRVLMRSPLREEARHQCATMLSHIRVRRVLEKFYPGNFVTLRYEDVVKDPFKSTESIFKLFGDKMGEFRHNVTKMMSGKNVDEKPFDVFRRNSSATAEAWRKSWSASSIKEVDMECAELYRIAGYEPVYQV